MAKKITELAKAKMKDIRQSMNLELNQADSLFELSKSISKISIQFMSITEKSIDACGLSLQKICNKHSFPGQSSSKLLSLFSQLGNIMSKLSAENQREIHKKLTGLTHTTHMKKESINSATTSVLKQCGNCVHNFSAQITKLQAAGLSLAESNLEQENSQKDSRLYYNRLYQIKLQLKVLRESRQLSEESTIATKFAGNANNIVQSLSVHSDIIKNQLKEEFLKAISVLMKAQITINLLQRSYFNQVKNVFSEENEEIYRVFMSDQDKVVQRLHRKNDGNIYPLGTQFPQIQAEMEDDLESSQNNIHKYHLAAQQFFEEYQSLIDERQKDWRYLISCLVNIAECLKKLQASLSNELISMESLIVSLAQDSLGELVFQLLKIFIRPVSAVLESIGQFAKNFDIAIKNLSKIAEEQQIQYTGFFNMINKQLESETSPELILETITFLGSSLPMLYESEKVRILSYEKICVEIEQDIYQNNEKAMEFAVEYGQQLEQFEGTIAREYHAIFTESMEKMIPLEKSIKSIISSVHFEVPSEFLALEKIDTEQQEHLLIETHIKYDKHSPIEQEDISNPQSSNNSLEQQQQGTSSPLFHSTSLPARFNNTQKKSKVVQKERDRYEAFFGISDEPFESYNCAFAHKILLQGKMHVFKDTLAFHSYFNAQNFVGSTALAIPFDDIISINKRKSALFFDTSIALSTVKGEILFTSFVARESCFKLVSFLLEEHKRKKVKNINQEQQIIFPISSGSLEEIEQNHSGIFNEKTMIEQELDVIDEKYQNINENEGNYLKNENKYQNDHKWERIGIDIEESDWVKERQMNWQNSSIMRDCEKISELEVEFKGAHPTDVFLVGFSARPFQKDSQIFASYQEYLHLKCYNDMEVNFTEMSPDVPDWFGKEEIDDELSQQTFNCSSEYKSNRTVTFIHPIKQKVFLGPKVSHCKIDETYYWMSPHCFVLEKEVFLSKIPYSNYFTVKYQFAFTFDSAKISTKMTIKFSVNFIKHTSFKNMIQTGSQTENMHQLTQYFIPKLEMAVTEYVQINKWRRNQSFKMIQNVQNSRAQEVEQFFRSHSDFTGVQSSRSFTLLLRNMTVKQIFKMFFSDENFTHPITKKIYPNFLSFSLGQQYKSDSVMIGMYSFQCFQSSNSCTYSQEECQTREFFVNEQQLTDDLKKETEQDRNKESYSVLGVENVFWLSQKEVVLERKDKILKEEISQGIQCRIKEMKTKENESNCQLIFTLFDVGVETENILVEIYQNTIKQGVFAEQQRKNQQCVHQSKRQAQESYGCLNEQLTTYKAKMLESQEKIQQIEKEFDNQKKMSSVIKAGLIMLVVMEIIRFIFSM